MQSNQTIEKFSQLVEWLELGCKNSGEEKIGIEIECFSFNKADNSPVPYFGSKGIQSILNYIADKTEAELVLENGNPIAIKLRDGAMVTLEPASQIELSSAVSPDLNSLENQVSNWRNLLSDVASNFDVGFLSVGMTPHWTIEGSPRTPKERYNIMRRYMTKVGSRGLDMMHRTATTQVSFDFTSESDMIRKFRVGLALQPFVSAMFATSPFAYGKPNGLVGGRNEVWLDTDNDRSGLLDFVFEPGMDFERYCRYALDVPMYFIPDKSGYKDVAGLDFKDFMNGKLSGLEGRYPTIAEWDNHLTTIFPEVRLKHYLEMRGADANSQEYSMLLASLWYGLLYDKDGLQGAYDLSMKYTTSERHTVYENSPKHGMNTEIRKYTISEVCSEIIDIAQHGLKNLNATNRADNLEVIKAVCQSKSSIANKMIDAYYHKWDQNLDKIYEVCDFSSSASFDI